MTRWTRSEAEVAALLRSADLQQLTGSQANGDQFLTKARRIIASAAGLVASDPDSAFVLAYDAARHAGVALLAHQGLRATSKGGPYALDLTLRAQFSPGFRQFSSLRRRRNELEYPAASAESTSQQEAQEAVDTATALIADAARLLPLLGLW